MYNLSQDWRSGLHTAVCRCCCRGLEDVQLTWCPKSIEIVYFVFLPGHLTEQKQSEYKESSHCKLLFGADSTAWCRVDCLVQKASVEVQNRSYSFMFELVLYLETICKGCLGTIGVCKNDELPENLAGEDPTTA
jgi:hypothetical protein